MLLWYFVTNLCEIQNSAVLIQTCAIYHEIDNSRHQKCIRIRTAASKRPDACFLSKIHLKLLLNVMNLR